MIARAWRGTTDAADRERYLKYLDETGVAACRATEGNRGVYVLRRDAGDRVEFLFISLWDDMESVRSFAGPDPEVAVFFPEDADFLIEREETVTHYEVGIAP